MKEKIKSLEETNKYTFSGVIFVTFKNINDLKKFKKNYPSTFIQKVLKSFKNCCLLRCCCCFLNDKDAKKLRSYLNLTVFKPPEPEDIIFSNLEFSFCYRFTKSVVNYLKVILLLGISFGSCLLFNYIQHKSEKNFESKTTLQYGISLCITVVTSLINFFIKSSFSDYTENEKMWSYTDKYLSLSIKISIFTFFNSGIVPLLTNYIEYGWKSHENLVNNMFMIFLCGSLVAPLSSLTCYDLLLNKIMKWWKVTRKYKDEKKIIKEYTQDELNKIFELPTMGVSMQYSYLVQQFCMAFFYTPLFPAGIILVIVGICLDYFIEKLKVIYIYKKPEMINEKICFFYMDYITLAFFCFGIGDYVFFSSTHSNRLYELFNCIFFICILIFPYNYLIRKVNYIEKNKYNMTYDKAYFTFNCDYERMNPKTQKQGVLNYLTKLYENDFIDKTTYEETKNSIDEINLKELLYFSNVNKQNLLKHKKYEAFISKLKTSAMLRKIINKNKGKDDNNDSSENKEAAKKQIEDCYKFGCFQANTFVNQIGLFKKKKKNKDKLKQQTINQNNDNANVYEYNFTSDDLINRKENLNFISPGFANNYVKSLNMQMNNLKTIKEEDANNFEYSFGNGVFSFKFNFNKGQNTNKTNNNKIVRNYVINSDKSKNNDNDKKNKNKSNNNVNVKVIKVNFQDNNNYNNDNNIIYEENNNDNNNNYNYNFNYEYNFNSNDFNNNNSNNNNVINIQSNNMNFNSNDDIQQNYNYSYNYNFNNNNQNYNFSYNLDSNNGFYFSQNINTNNQNDNNNNMNFNIDLNNPMFDMFYYY